MVKRTGPSNYQVQLLLAELEPKAKASKFWKRILLDLNKPTRQRRVVNLYKIDKAARNGEMIVVPGKVLSEGTISKQVEVAAMSFSEQAKQKIEAAQGKVYSIKELLQKNPDGKNVRILG